MGQAITQVEDAAGERIDNPSERQLHDMLSHMNLRWRYVILSRYDKKPADQHYIQVYLNDDFSYHLEYRDGGPDRHFQTLIPAQPDPIGCEPVARVMYGWATDRPDWKGGLTWERRS
jgi:hypothetical protein